MAINTLQGENFKILVEYYSIAIHMNIGNTILTPENFETLVEYYSIAIMTGVVYPLAFLIFQL